jgi:hypothetical protein
MLKLTIKISRYSLLHVSAHPDHPQGAYAERCKSYAFVELISKNTSLCFSVWWQLVVCVLSALQRASHAARHSVHTPQPETHVATTLRHL